MKFASISFPTRDLAVQAYYELARRGLVASLPDGQFIVPEPAVAFLQAEGLAHAVHAWLNRDHVTQPLGNTPATSMSRRNGPPAGRVWFYESNPQE